MNTPDQGTPGQDTPGMARDARESEAQEWAAQERARQQVRDATSTASPDAADAAYRRIAAALRHPPRVELPVDFAARVARIAEAPVPAPIPVPVPEGMRPRLLSQSGAFEQALLRALVAVFALCALAAGLVYGASVSAQLQAAIGVQGVEWTVLLAGCLGLSWSFEWLRRRAGHDGTRPA